MADTDLLELDSPALDAAEEPIEPDEITAEGDQPASEETEGEPKPPITSLFQPDGKKLDPRVKEALGKFKADNPDAAKLITKAVYKVAELDREFPGGLTEAKELRNEIDAMGGVSGIKDQLEVAQRYDGLAGAFEKADPAFVDDLVESYPASFAQLAPKMFSEYARIHPEGWQKYIGQIVVADFARNQVPLVMMRLADVIADNPKAIPLYNQINAYLATFQELADKKADVPKFEEPKAAPTDQREASLQQREWKLESTTLQARVANDEYKRVLAGRSVDTETKAEIKELFITKSESLTRQYFPGYADKLKAFAQRGDKAGYMRFLTTIYRRVMPESTAWAVSKALKGKPTAPAAKAAPVAKAAPPATNGNNPRNSDGTFKPISAEPGPWDVDYDRTDVKLLRENRAFLKDGRRVSWK